MKKQERNRGMLTVEATISYTIFMMVVLTLLYIMRIVYAYALVQHAVSQTAKELSMYTYLYQVSGANSLVGQLQSGVQAGEAQFNADAQSVVNIYNTLTDGWDDGDIDTIEGEWDNITKDPACNLRKAGIDHIS